ncbi:LysR substrate-binding domain-containing protein [Afipia carboxidovorans]|uniref:LysR substrate-binding domain-containing protein n=1 Tax=Afipia carboxidovorans TaxID=40137 RepID=UPI0003016224|nr:LysR substrate-binding domain-containing protein [Afipia carboxidovorans]
MSKRVKTSSMTNQADPSPLPICVLDRETRYLAASPSYAKLCGAPLHAVAGKSMLDFCSPELVANARRDFSAFDAGKSIQKHKITFRGRDFLVSVNPVYENMGEAVVAISVALTDVSNARKPETTTNFGAGGFPSSNNEWVGKGIDADERSRLADGDESAKRSETSISQNPREQNRISIQESFARGGSPLGSRITLTALIQTLAVAEYLNFRHAANALGVSQSSISERIKALEDTFGIPLFERHARGVKLTDAGRCFVERVAISVAQLDHAVKTIGMMARGDRGRLRIGVHALIPGSFLTEVIGQYHAQYPDVDVEIAEGTASEVVSQLRAGRLDVAFVAGTPEYPDLHSTCIWTEPLVVALPANHPLVDRNGITWADLAGEAFLVRYGGTGPQVHDHILLRLAGRWLSPSILRLAVERGSLLSMIAQGYGVTIAGSAHTLIRPPGVVFLPFLDEPEPVPFSGVWSPHNRSAVLRNLLDLANQMSRGARTP